MMNFSVIQAAKILSNFFLSRSYLPLKSFAASEETKNIRNFERIQYQNNSYTKFQTYHQHERKSNSKQIFILKTPNKFFNFMIKIS